MRTIKTIGFLSIITWGILQNGTGYPKDIPGAVPYTSVFHARTLVNPLSKAEGATKQDGIYRRQVVLPDGKVFRAIVNLGWANRLWINGQSVGALQGLIWGEQGYWMQGVEITDLLIPGKTNVVVLGVAGWPDNTYLEGDVVMDSGAVIHLATEAGQWKAGLLEDKDKWTSADQYFYTKDDPVPAWAKIDFNDTGWPVVSNTAWPAGLVYEYGRLPVYSGRLVLENPNEEKLYYDDTRDVCLRVRIPQGLAEKKPKVVCKIRSVPGSNEVFKNETSEFKTMKDGVSAMVEFNAGKLGRGVYAVDLSADTGAKEPETHVNEGLVVFGKVPMKPAKLGQSWEESVKLRLVDTINCADTNDTHSFTQGGYGESVIINRNGLNYREAGPGRGKGRDTSFFCYKVRFPEADRPYVVVFEYPDDTERNMGFGVAHFAPDAYQQVQKMIAKTNQDIAWNSIAKGEGGGVVCGGRYPLSKQVRRFPILYYPRYQDAFVFAVTHASDCPAALSRVQIYALEEPLPEMPALPSGERFLGKHTERGYSFAPMVCGTNINLFSGQFMSPEMLALWYKAAERYAEYLRFTGENLHVMGFYQYDDANTPYARPTLIRGKHSRPEPEYRDIAARAFAANGIAFMANIEPAKMIFHKGPDDGDVVSNGVDTVWCVSREGKQRKAIPNSYHALTIWILPNIFHPKVERYMMGLVDEICERYTANPAFKGFVYFGMGGINNKHAIMPNYVNDPMDWGYEDVTMAQFEKDTGLKVDGAVGDPQRFEKRYQWIQTHARDQWLEWRCQRVHKFYEAHLKRMQTHRPDLKMIVAHSQSETADTAADMRLEGVDLKLYQNEPIAFSRVLSWNSGSSEPERYAFKVTSMQSPVLNRLFDREVLRPAFVNNGFEENYIKYQPTEEWPLYRIFLGDEAPAAAGEHFARQFTEMLANTDMNVFMMSFFDGQIAPGHEECTRNFAAGYLPLPGAKLALIQGNKIDSNLVVRGARVGKTYVFYVLNPAWWQAKVEVILQGCDKGLKDLASGTEVSLQTVERQQKLTLDLPPYTLRSFQSGNRKAEVVAVTADLGPDTTRARQFYGEKADRLEKKLDSRKVLQILSDEDKAFLKQTLVSVRADLNANRFLTAETSLYGPKMERLTDVMARAAYVTPWFVLGQFPGDKTGDIFRKDSEVERDVLAGKILRDKEYEGGLDVKGQPVKHKWRLALTGKQGWTGCENFMDFCWPKGVIPMRDYTIAYAYTSVRAPADMDAILSTGSDDGIRVWLNGEMVLDKYIARGAAPGQEKTPVKLKKGVNQLLVKIDNQLGGAGFFVDFVNPDGTPIADLDIFP